MVICFRSDLLFGAETTFCAVEMIMHTVHGVVLNAARYAHQLVLLFPVELCVVCLGSALKLVAKAALGGVEVVVHPVH